MNLVLKHSSVPQIVFGTLPLSLRDLAAIARGERGVKIAPEALDRMESSRALFERHVADGAHIYGVNTGYGASVKNRVPATADLALNLLRFHGCGTGRLLSPVESAAVVATRLCSLVQGGSGVRPEVGLRLAEFLNRRILPVIPAEGSVGASGDLTPLSYVAASLIGEREMYAPSGALRPANEVLADQGLEPLILEPKESLALMNGTSVASALAVLAFSRAAQVAELSARVTALVSVAIEGNPQHFAAITHERKGHPGQIAAARWVREELAQLPQVKTPARLQDRYSIRCMPQVVGVLVDALGFIERTLQTEINGVTDNPIVDVDSGTILHGGNFYGGHVSFAMDGLKTAVANIADLLDRQLVLLCQPLETNHLPENLVGVLGEGRLSHHGFKAMSISASALTAEALKQSLPMSVFSRSTESHNQDKVPMATIAARDALRVVELTEKVLAITILGACQAAELRLGREAGPLHGLVRKHVGVLIEDRRMDVDIQKILDLLESGELCATFSESKQ